MSYHLRAGIPCFRAHPSQSHAIASPVTRFHTRTHALSLSALATSIIINVLTLNLTTGRAMPANFKTYEAQARLLAAVVAAHPGLKLDYKGKSDSVNLSGVSLYIPVPHCRVFTCASSALESCRKERATCREGTTGLICSSRGSTLRLRYDHLGY